MQSQTLIHLAFLTSENKLRGAPETEHPEKRQHTPLRLNQMTKKIRF